MLSQDCNDLTLVFFPITPTTLDRTCLNSTFLRQLQPTSTALITDDNRYVSIRNSPIANSIAQRQHV